MGWIKNKADGEKPPQHMPVLIRTADGQELTASYLKDVNKYVRNVNSWRKIKDGKYLPDKEVTEWKRHE